MPVRILVADFSIWTMDNKLGFLIAGNAPCNFDCFCLCLGSRCSAGVPFAFYLPPAIGVRSYVLIFSFILSSFQKMKRMKPPTSFLWLLFSSFYGNAKCFQAILTGVNALAIFKRNKRSIDVLYGIVMSFSHKHSTSFKRDFSETNFGFA